MRALGEGTPHPEGFLTPACVGATLLERLHILRLLVFFCLVASLPTAEAAPTWEEIGNEAQHRRSPAKSSAGSLSALRNDLSSRDFPSKVETWVGPDVNVPAVDLLQADDAIDKIFGVISPPDGSEFRIGHRDSSHNPSVSILGPTHRFFQELLRRPPPGE